MPQETNIAVDEPRTLRAVLFIDFDNLYSGLRQLNPAAAELFATEPARWVATLGDVGQQEGVGRRFLIRRCYLNPRVHGRFRKFFTRAGFRVIDCPSLTQQGKSSADINLVLDVVDALSANTRYDEFIIASGDADFTPLVDRCRAFDRRVVAITAGPSASAYRAVADEVMAADRLVEASVPQVRGSDGTLPKQVPSHERTVPDEGRVFGGPGGNPILASADSRVDTAAVERVLTVLRTAPGPVYSSVVAQAAQDADPGLRPANWGGMGTFGAWLRSRVPGAGYAPRPGPGYVWDAQRFTEDDIPRRTPAGVAP
ncbi:uncharacterized LabA/DUF88 family protein [Georgenia soli]|uniref:Uncharacterized LabA/DUF88 family protein n=1 Tax=Georgenia soli TaxID=638953 RepID=A0A2A9EJ09_9MICO|nr:NYN domain-containing protein [Georgenia soli]PFG38235.1 uncharacterized LabA/DUF88 family protein [Georgenia soli]